VLAQGAARYYKEIRNRLFVAKTDSEGERIELYGELGQLISFKNDLLDKDVFQNTAAEALSGEGCGSGVAMRSLEFFLRIAPQFAMQETVDALYDLSRTGGRDHGEAPVQKTMRSVFESFGLRDVSARPVFGAIVQQRADLRKSEWVEQLLSEIELSQSKKSLAAAFARISETKAKVRTSLGFVSERRTLGKTDPAADFRCMAMNTLLELAGRTDMLDNKALKRVQAISRDDPDYYIRGRAMHVICEATSQDGKELDAELLNRVIIDGSTSKFRQCRSLTQNIVNAALHHRGDLVDAVVLKCVKDACDDESSYIRGLAMVNAEVLKTKYPELAVERPERPSTGKVDYLSIIFG
ncbi:MAG: hypothetical protein PHE27_06265, partial [Alphaproteobacteria bacterium]|nr:hypothetical protein [Alphaproteobacteria bacterium]